MTCARQIGALPEVDSCHSHQHITSTTRSAALQAQRHHAWPSAWQRCACDFCAACRPLQRVRACMEQRSSKKSLLAPRVWGGAGEHRPRRRRARCRLSSSQSSTHRLLPSAAPPRRVGALRGSSPPSPAAMAPVLIQVDFAHQVGASGGGWLAAWVARTSSERRFEP